MVATYMLYTVLATTYFIGDNSTFISCRVIMEQTIVLSLFCIYDFQISKKNEHWPDTQIWKTISQASGVLTTREIIVIHLKYFWCVFF